MPKKIGRINEEKVYVGIKKKTVKKMKRKKIKSKKKKEHFGI